MKTEQDQITALSIDADGMYHWKGHCRWCATAYEHVTEPLGWATSSPIALQLGVCDSCCYKAHERIENT